MALTLFNLFWQGGVVYMFVLTIVLILLFIAAWKAPAWVKEIGIGAHALGLLFFLAQIITAGLSLTGGGDLALALLLGSVSYALIPEVYGLIIYIISIIIRLTQKPRI